LAVNDIGPSLETSDALSIQLVPGFTPKPPTINDVARLTRDSLKITLAAQTTAEETGGSAILGYLCEADGVDADVSSVSLLQPMATPVIGPLRQGKKYTVSCIGVNSAGNSTKSPPSSEKMMGGIADPVDVLSVQATKDSKITYVSFTEANSTLQPPLNQMGYDCSATDGSNTITGSNGSSPIELPHLVGGSTYTVSCKATNALGESEQGALLSFTPIYYPDMPTDLKVTHTAIDELTVAFTAPTDMGGEALKEITCKATPKDQAISVVSMSQLTSPIVLSNLNPGKKYEVQCQAVNTAAGGGAWSQKVIAWAGSVPNAPTFKSGSPSFEVTEPTVMIYLNEMVATPPVSAYKCSSQQVPVKFAVSTNASEPVVFRSGDPETELNTGTHTFVCFAINGVGESVGSEESDPVTPITLPGPPSSVTAQYKGTSGTELQLTFDASPNDGGDAVVDYECTVGEANSSTGDPLIRSLSFDSLNSGEEYDIKCRAENGKGWGQSWSESIAFVPLAVAAAPANMSAVCFAPNQVRVDFDVDSASPYFLNQTVTCWSGANRESEAHVQVSRQTASQSLVLLNLLEGVTHSISCEAHNEVNLAVGADPTESKNGVYVLVKIAPLAPEIVSVMPDSGKVIIKIQASRAMTGNNFSATIGYGCRTRSEPQVETFASLSGDGSIELAGIENGRTLMVECRSKSSIGWSAWSMPSRNVTTGVGIETTLEMDDSDEDLTIEELRQKLAEEWGVDPSQIVIEEQPLDSSISGGRRRQRRRLSSKKKYKIKVLIADDASSETNAKADEIVKNMNDVSNLCRTVLKRSGCFTTTVTRVEPAFKDASLRQLEFSDVSGNPKFELVPRFQPSVHKYTVRVPEKDFALNAVANSTFQTDGSVVVNGKQLSLSYNQYAVNRSTDQIGGTHAHREWKKTMHIRVTAPDKTSEQNYYVTVNFSKQCGQQCHDEGFSEDEQGFCDFFTGTCKCRENWEISTPHEICNSWCPAPEGDSLPCGSHGRCDGGLTNKNASFSGGKCKCDDTYGGDDCATRECLSCKNGGTCNEKDWTCTCMGGWKGDTCEEEEPKEPMVCPNGWKGKQCDEPWCPRNMTSNEDCHDNGVCNEPNKEDGHTQPHCTCKGGYGSPNRTHLKKITTESDRISNDCSEKLPKAANYVALGSQVELSLVWGIKNYERKYNSSSEEFAVTPVYNEAFGDGATNFRKALAWIRSICDTARDTKDYDLRVRDHQPCWVNHPNFVDDETVPLEETLRKFFTKQPLKTGYESGNAVEDQWWNFWNDIGTEGEDFHGRVKFIRVRMTIAVKRSEGAREKRPTYDEWVRFLAEKVNSNAPAGVGKAILVSDQFKKMDLELRIISSTLGSWMLSNVICLASVLLFTRNVLISLYTMLSIVLIVATLLGIIFGAAGYPFGAIEAVGVTIFVGLSVDYILHAAHGYSESKKTGRKDKVTDMLTRLGISIVGGAITTAGSCIFLFFCHIFLFVQLGVMLFFNCLIALFFAQLFLSAMLMVIGPLEDQGSPRWCITGGCCKGMLFVCKKDKTDDAAWDGKKSSATAVTAVMPITADAQPVIDGGLKGLAPNSPIDQTDAERKGMEESVANGSVQSWEI
jgi:hypothetical protein